VLCKGLKSCSTGRFGLVTVFEKKSQKQCQSQIAGEQGVEAVEFLQKRRFQRFLQIRLFGCFLSLWCVSVCDLIDIIHRKQKCHGELQT
jgi:hypothetical protein